MLCFILFQVSITYSESSIKYKCFDSRAEYTKEIVKPTLGERGVGGAMAVYGVFDAIVSGPVRKWPVLVLIQVDHDLLIMIYFNFQAIDAFTSNTEYW